MTRDAILDRIASLESKAAIAYHAGQLARATRLASALEELYQELADCEPVSRADYWDTGDELL